MAAGVGEKTEKATPKKRRDARERGQVLKSAEVNTAFGCIVMFTLLLLLWPSLTERMTSLYTEFLSAPAVLPPGGEVTNAVFSGALRRALMSLGRIMLPILGTALAAGVVINVLQIGFLFTTKTLSPKLDRISPIKGFSRVFSIRTLTELVKSVLKVALLGYVAYTSYRGLLEEFPNYIGRDIRNLFLSTMNTAFVIALKMAAAFALIAAGDYLFQWWKFEKDMRMTKQEVKDEYKMTEGDPQIKSKIRQKQRQMSAMRMMSQVPTADVVITNPTHYAVALKYEDGVSDAPAVVAKGKDFLAMKIRETAAEHGVELVENKTLARALYEGCELGDLIPPEFYQVVADILVYVYRKKRGGARPRA
ncbi:MAG: flagellar biosynthesis protein FlhB [Oscillospiraceae bacterium]|jgi:flagellar biosynthetic protein FlhB|nr:flagellar biosynthesis protein FlhB [Oscillospiraceae bacterium]